MSRSPVSEAPLRLEEVSKSYAARPVIDDVSLTVPPGETLILIGPSGCGKSTLLRLMLGLVRADRGCVLFHGRPLTPESIRSVRRRIGYVVQDGGLFPHMTARENITLMADRMAWDPARTDQRLTELIGLTNFPGDGLDRYPAELSGGQQQRIALMRALMLDPELLLLDEPLGALDPMVRYDLQDDLRQIFRTLNKTVLLVTHDLAEAAYFGTRIVLMREGRIVQEGTIRDLLERPADPFVGRFFAAQRSVHGEQVSA